MDFITLLGLASVAFTAVFTYRAYYANETGEGPQSRRASIIEAWTNIVIGFSVNYAVNFLLLPMVGAQLTLANNFWLGWIYTAVSILRQYVIRRYFNAHDFAARLAGGRHA